MDRLFSSFDTGAIFSCARTDMIERKMRAGIAQIVFLLKIRDNIIKVWVSALVKGMDNHPHPKFLFTELKKQRNGRRFTSIKPEP
jgi:hypothetical protein